MRQVQALPGYFDKFVDLFMRDDERRRGNNRIANGPHHEPVVDEEIAADRAGALVLVEFLERFFICDIADMAAVSQAVSCWVGRSSAYLQTD